MELEFVIQSIITLLSLLVAATAWIAKIRWSKEYMNAKEAQIELISQEAKFYKERVSEGLLNYQKRQVEELEKIIEKYKKNSDTSDLQETNEKLRNGYVILQKDFESGMDNLLNKLADINTKVDKNSDSLTWQ